MNNRLFRFATIIMVVGLVSACSKDANKRAKEDGLSGTWEWVRTDGGIAFNIHDTPMSTGKNIDLKITLDGKYFLYTNGSLTSEGTYLLETRKCIHDKVDKPVIKFSSLSDFMVEKLDQNSLELSDEAYDGTGSLYKRKKSSSN
ncbi:MAG: hypothetical protein ABI675_04800 [Chitinophagaceae bacterium]